MGVRRQIYLDESDDLLLEAESRRSGLSVSELVRRAIQQHYGPGRRLTWDEAFAHSVQASSDPSSPWVYDPLFDDGWIDEALADRFVEATGHFTGLPS